MNERYYHCIFVCSNYTTGKREGLHFLFNESNLSSIAEISDKYSKEEGVSMYAIITDDPSIDSIQKKDAFFRNINIKEGHIQANVISFDKALRNQVRAFDLALLLASREKTTKEKLNLYLLVCYCSYVLKYDKTPFDDKFYVGSSNAGFRDINKEFKDIGPNQIIRCTKTNVIISKFFNSEEGTKMMNNLLMLHYKISNINFNLLELSASSFLKDVEVFFNTEKGYRKRIKKEQLYLIPKVIKNSFLHHFPYMSKILDLE